MVHIFRSIRSYCRKLFRRGFVQAQSYVLSYPLADYTLTLREAIWQGCFNFKDEFLLVEAGDIEGVDSSSEDVEVDVVRFNPEHRDFFPTSMVESALATKHYHPASPHDLVFLGTQKPKLQNKYILVCLGQTFKYNGKHYVMVLDFDRSIRFMPYHSRWSSDYAFIARRRPLAPVIHIRSVISGS